MEPAANAARRAAPALAGAVLVVTLGCAPALAQTIVYRCVDPAGAIELRQTPCPAHAHGGEIEVEERFTGWVPPSAPEPPRSEPARASPKAPGAGSRGGTSAKRRHECLEQQRKIDEINRALRRGYAPAEGERLRRERRGLEEHLYHHCG